MNPRTSRAAASAALLTLALGGCASTGMDTAADGPDAMSSTAVSGSAGSTMASGTTGTTAGDTMAGAAAGGSAMAGATAGTSAAGTAATGTAGASGAMSGDTQAGATAQHDHGMPGGTPPKASSPAEALTLVALVDQHELKLAQLTQTKQVSEPVREYAAMMINDHNPHLEKTRALLQSAGGMQQNSADAQQLMAFDKRTQQQLGGLQGDAYARAYMEHMVASHQMGIQMVDASMSVATDPAQREFLQKTKQTMQMHLQRAQQVHSQLGG